MRPWSRAAAAVVGSNPGTGWASWWPMSPSMRTSRWRRWLDGSHDPIAASSGASQEASSCWARSISGRTWSRCRPPRRRCAEPGSARDHRRLPARSCEVSSQPVVYAELPHALHSFDLFHSIRLETVVDAVEAFTAWVRTRRGARTRRSKRPAARLERCGPASPRSTHTKAISSLLRGQPLLGGERVEDVIAISVSLAWSY